jgi:hypothetical protein
VEALMYFIYFRARGTYAVDDEPFSLADALSFARHLTNHESIWLVPGTHNEED